MFNNSALAQNFLSLRGTVMQTLSKTPTNTNTAGPKGLPLGSSFLTMSTLLRMEGLVYLCGGALAYFQFGGGWLVFAIFFLAPDVSLAGYLLNARTAAILYNVAHSTIGPLVLALAAYTVDWHAGGLAAAIWFAHIGFDRVLGYGLKHFSGFTDTHLGRIGKA